MFFFLGTICSLRGGDQGVYRITLTALTLNNLWKCLKFSRNAFLNKNIKLLRKIKKSFEKFYLSTWNFQNWLIIQQTFVEVGLVII
jgi:hypothetical protein